MPKGHERNLNSVLLIAVGSAPGALSRHKLDTAVTRLLGPPLLGIFIVNVTGSFLLGVSMSATETHITWQNSARLFASYTTLSARTVATIETIQDGDITRAAFNIGGSITVGLAAALLGLYFGKLLQAPQVD